MLTRSPENSLPLDVQGVDEAAIEIVAEPPFESVVAVDASVGAAATLQAASVEVRGVALDATEPIW